MSVKLGPEDRADAVLERAGVTGPQHPAEIPGLIAGEAGVQLP